MCEPMLPFDDEEPVRLKPDPTQVVDRDNGPRLERDGDGVLCGVRLKPDHDDNLRGVRLQPDLPNATARRYAVDPSKNIVLEASAGTGKTQVLVERYVNLLRAGVEPDHILAFTFTRKAAAEMRLRVIERLKEASRLSELDTARWRDVRERLGDIAVSTIDAFCLSLLREFPLEADVDPGFDLADNTEVPRLIGESLDQALRICRGIARDDDDVALGFAQLGERGLRGGVATLLDRRLVAPHALRRFLQKGLRDLIAATACARAAARLRDVFAGVRDGVEAFLGDGPVRHPQFAMLADDVRRLSSESAIPESAIESAIRHPQSGMSSREAQAAFRALVDRLRAYFLTQDGKPRTEKFAGTRFTAADCDCADAWKRHRAAASQIAPAVAEAIRAFRRDLNAVMSRGVWRIFAVAMRQYQHTLEAHALLDFSGVLERAVKLLRDMDEFAESRLRLEARHRHVLVDEFQDTSRAQWELVRQLVKSWGEGVGAAHDAIPPSIFLVGDRKQSIYGFRDADVGDRTDGVRRQARAADIAILYRSRDSHRDFEAALDRRGVPTYIYKGLGFFDADEIQDAVALLRYLADPLSDLRAATLLRSRIVRLSDTAVARLGPESAAAILSVNPPPALAALGDEDRRVLALLRRAVPRWLSWVDRLAPSELFDTVLHETAYAFELRGSRRRQARENLKKLRGMI